MEVVRIPIDELDGSYQTRVQTDNSTVEKYANDFNEYGGWGDFPPLEVIIVCGVKHIANGIHRYKAAKLAGLSECPCTVREGTLLEVHKISTRGNYRQGLSYTAADRKHSRELAILTFWPTGEYTPKEIGDACECSDDTIRREIKRLESEGKLEHVDFIVRSDGKTVPTKHSKTANADLETQPAKTANADLETQPDYTLCPQCGAPIWPENKGNPDYTYTERRGKWFCSEECADQWEQERLSDEAEAITGIPDELPETPTAALPTDVNSLPVCNMEEPDLESLPICEDEEPEAEAVLLECVVKIRVPGVAGPEEALEKVQKRLPAIVNSGSDFQIEGATILYLNNLNILNNSIVAVDSEKFTELFAIVRDGKKVSRKYITKSMFDQWQAEFGSRFNVEKCLREWCDYWNLRRGDEILKAGRFWTCAKSHLQHKAEQADADRKHSGPYRDESGLTSQEGY